MQREEKVTYEASKEIQKRKLPEAMTKFFRWLTKRIYKPQNV